MKMAGSCEIPVFDSVTHIGENMRGRAVIAASHGGVYAVHHALQQGVGGLVVCDAGVGIDSAGISGLAYADGFGVPCAAIHHLSARIGDGANCAAQGLVSFANERALQLGVRVGMLALEAAKRMDAAGLQAVDPGDSPVEARVSLAAREGLRPIVLLDSASLVTPQEEGCVVLTASHGGLLGGRPETAIKVQVFAALFNDAGIGRDQAGISRLPALHSRGIAAATVTAHSARIGDARSAWATGLISHVNPVCYALGGREGQTAYEWAELMASATATSENILN